MYYHLFNNTCNSRTCIITCSTTLMQGRCRWRHDNILREAADWLEYERKKERRSNTHQCHINFVRPRESDKAETVQKPSIIDSSQVWNMSMNLFKNLFSRQHWDHILGCLFFQYKKGHYSANSTLGIKIRREKGSQVYSAHGAMPSTVVTHIAFPKLKSAYVVSVYNQCTDWW